MTENKKNPSFADVMGMIEFTCEGCEEDVALPKDTKNFHCPKCGFDNCDNPEITGEDETA